VAEAKRDPRNASYWSNPEVDLIGVFVKKSFGTHGTFRGKFKSFKRPYFKVVYSDGDEEELRLAEVLQLIDIRNLQSREGTDKEFIEQDLEDINQCTCLFEYTDYMHFNNTVFSDRRENSNYSYLNYNPYLSIEDMQHIKEVLDFDRNIEVDEDAIEEAYDFLIDTVDVDVMQEMET
jgi:hypothetical protein